MPTKKQIYVDISHPWFKNPDAPCEDMVTNVDNPRERCIQREYDALPYSDEEERERGYSSHNQENKSCSNEEYPRITTPDTATSFTTTTTTTTTTTNLPEYHSLQRKGNDHDNVRKGTCQKISSIAHSHSIESPTTSSNLRCANVGDATTTSHKGSIARNSVETLTAASSLRQDRTPQEEEEKEKENPYFDIMFQQLLTFKNTHGHCNVPQNAKKEAKHFELGIWCRQIRLFYKSKLKSASKYKLTSTNIQSLNQIGFQWTLSKPRTSFDDRIKELIAYKEKFGHTNVPYRNKQGYASLANWIRDVRYTYYQSQMKGGYISTGMLHQLSDSRIRQLEDIGFQWRVNKRNM